ncbi:hypothetical protein AB5J49_17475 [Streptomyces sp. R28]|uniref:Uncharacterized protein n=1 Tax=Streptomyces sp. R28 TaxID=3238628 RepID=A0AB39Q1B8_9ACTN
MIGFTERWLRLAAGLLLGGLTALAELVCVTAGGVRRMRATLTTGGPPSAPASALRLAELERRRLAVFHAAELDPPRDGQAASAYVAARWPLGLFGLLVLLTALIGLAYASLLVWAWFVLDPDHPADG